MEAVTGAEPEEMDVEPEEEIAEPENREEVEECLTGLLQEERAAFCSSCTALQALCMDAKMQPIPGNQQLAVSSGAVEITMRALGTHAEDAATAAATLSLLCALLRKHGTAVEVAMEEGFAAALPACLKAHSEDEPVQSAACTAVFSACWDNDGVQDALREAGVVELVLAAMERHCASGRVQAMACAALLDRRQQLLHHDHHANGQYQVK